MKLFTFLLFVIFIVTFSSCENYRESHDVVNGTPSRADTVLPHKYAPMQQAKTETNEEVPEVYKR